jgi:hypothetical protein
MDACTGGSHHAAIGLVGVDMSSQIGPALLFQPFAKGMGHTAQLNVGGWLRGGPSRKGAPAPGFRRGQLQRRWLLSWAGVSWLERRLPYW